MVRIERQLRLPFTVFDSLAQTHASVDPDTGHLVCHYYEVGAAVVEVSGKKYPMMLIGGCILATTDPEAVEAIESESREIDGIPARLHSDPSVAQWLSVMLQLVRDLQGKVKVYATPMDSAQALTITSRNKGVVVAVILNPSCLQLGERREKGAGLYL